MKRRILLLLSLIILLHTFPLWAEADDFALRIGVLDTGIFYRHDGLKEIEIESGENFVFPGSNTIDLLGHGTRVAGLIVKECSNVTLIPMVLVSRYPTGLQKSCNAWEIAYAIIKAIDEYDCKVLNLSLGLREDDEELRKAIEYAEEKNVIVVAAAGNNKKAESEILYYPAAYETVIAVSAVDEEGNIASFSQGTYSLISALGVEVPVLSFGFSIKPPKVSGSSYAAATVSGWVSEILMNNPDYSPAQVREALENCQVRYLRMKPQEK